MKEPFWVIWNPDHLSTPIVRYPTRKLATHAARTMAKRSAREGAVFYVLKAQSAHQQQIEMCDFTFVPWGIGAPCPYHGVQ